MEKTMSLYETFYEPCRIMNKVKIRDPEGGIINTWTEGEEIQVAFQGLTRKNCRTAGDGAVYRHHHHTEGDGA